MYWDGGIYIWVAMCGDVADFAEIGTIFATPWSNPCFLGMGFAFTTSATNKKQSRSTPPVTLGLPLHLLRWMGNEQETDACSILIVPKLAFHTRYQNKAKKLKAFQFFVPWDYRPNVGPAPYWWTNSGAPLWIWFWDFTTDMKKARFCIGGYMAMIAMPRSRTVQHFTRHSNWLEPHN